MSENSLIIWIESVILEYLRDYGTATESKLVNYVWRNSNDENYLDHVPNEEVTRALENLCQQKKVKVDKSTGLIIHDEEYIEFEIDQSQTHNAKSYLRVMGDYISRSSLPLPLNHISSQFNHLNEFESRVEDGLYLHCEWKKEGIISFLVLSDKGEFTIQVYFSTSEHPELIINDILQQSAKDELMKTGLGMGFFTMHSKCKSILSSLNITVLAVITSFELLETRR